MKSNEEVAAIPTPGRRLEVSPYKMPAAGVTHPTSESFCHGFMSKCLKQAQRVLNGGTLDEWIEGMLENRHHRYDRPQLVNGIRALAGRNMIEIDDQQRVTFTGAFGILNW